MLINSGGYILLGPNIRSWFAQPIAGAVADVVGAVAIVAAVGWLVRRERPTGVLLGGGLIIGGWTSNILDRLGLHNLTAPGSARGVVDFIPDGTPGRSNVADVCIVAGAVVLAFTLVRHRLSGQPRDPTPGNYRAGVRVRIVVLILLLAVITLAVTSAVDDGGAHAPAAQSLPVQAMTRVIGYLISGAYHPGRPWP